MRHFDDPGIAGVGGSLQEGGNRTAANRWRAVHLSQSAGAMEVDVPFLPGCNTVYRVQALQEVGGFDGNCLRHHEDTDIGNKLCAAGYILKYDPRARAQHIKNDTTRSVFRSAWGFRNNTVPPSCVNVVMRSFRDIMHAIKCAVIDLVSLRFDCVVLDVIYPFFQMWFSFVAWRQGAWPV